MVVHWAVIHVLVQTSRVALMVLIATESGEGLRCFCESFIDGAPLVPPPVECDVNNKTCHIPESRGSASGVCYTELVFHSSSGIEYITHSCAYVGRYNLTLASTPCINSSRAGLVEMACCSTDYCNIDLLQGRSTLSSLTEPSSVDQSKDEQWLTWKIGTVIFSCFIVVVVLTGLLLFVYTLIYVQCRRKHIHTLTAHI